MPLNTKSHQEIFQQITDIAQQFGPNQENYLSSYPYLLNYFAQIDEIQLEHLVIGISFTYSWMPTILKRMDLSNSTQLLISLNKAKYGVLLNADELQQLKNSLNNSLVGTSKLLHFIAPQHYAIWDSRVFRFLTGKEPHNVKFTQPKTYLEYLQLLDVLKSDIQFDAYFQLMIKKIGTPVTAYRALELAFFKGG